MRHIESTPATGSSAVPATNMRYALARARHFLRALILVAGAVAGMPDGAFAQEAKQDRVFEETLFWVVTRSLHCFY